MASGNLRRAAARAEASPPARLTLQQVYEAHMRYVWRCLRGLGVSEASLDDAVHDVFLVVQDKLHTFDGADAALTTWLYAIALRVGRRHRVRNAKERQRTAGDVIGVESDDESTSAPLAACAADAELELVQNEQLELARRALAALDDDKREVFVLSCIEQRSAPDIADITGVPLNTVYSRLRAARLAFKGEIDRLLSQRRAP
jgi:RNA polymerase sigma-70 factor (ECF subfamily)